jgi:DNA modification methylase
MCTKMTPINTIRAIDCLKGLKELPDDSVQTCISSPPYWQLRDYNIKGQIGLEPTPAEYIERLSAVFMEVMRVLRQDGTLWLNLGDTYNAYKANTGDTKFAGFTGRPGHKRGLLDPTLKNKDLIGIPWRVALALQAKGYYLRQDIIWHKPNPMPESVTGRCTKAHEYLFLFSKSDRYYFDHEAIKQPLKESSIRRLTQDVENQAGSNRVPGKTNGSMKAVGYVVGGKKHKNDQVPGKAYPFHRTRNANGEEWSSCDGKCNKRSVWTVASRPFKEAHFATFPEALIVDCVKAGSSSGDLVLDPFMGAGTTALVAATLGRNYIGFELNPAYCTIARKRLKERLGIFQLGT